MNMIKGTIHRGAKTTPTTREDIQKSSLSLRQLSRQYKVTRGTVRKWKTRDSVEDKSHQPHQLHTTLTRDQEAIVVYLRKKFLLPLDDLFVTTRALIHPDVSRSGLHRCLIRHDLAALEQVKVALPKRSGIKKVAPKISHDNASGLIELVAEDLSELTGEADRGHLFVAIHRPTRWIYLEILTDKKARSVQGFYKRLHQKAPFSIKTLSNL
jgi:hypothetical protein